MRLSDQGAAAAACHVTCDTRAMQACHSSCLRSPGCERSFTRTRHVRLCDEASDEASDAARRLRGGDSGLNKTKEAGNKTGLGKHTRTPSTRMVVTRAAKGVRQRVRRGRGCCMSPLYQGSSNTPPLLHPSSATLARIAQPCLVVRLQAAMHATATTRHRPALQRSAGAPRGHVHIDKTIDKTTAMHPGAPSPPAAFPSGQRRLHSQTPDPHIS
jgi:hypothetical protein